MSLYFHTKDYVPGLHDLLRALSCQFYYKWEKPKKFAGGKWSPKAEQVYNSFDSKWKKAFDDAWNIYEEAHSKRGVIYEDNSEEQCLSGVCNL